MQFYCFLNNQNFQNASFYIASSKQYIYLIPIIRIEPTVELNHRQVGFEKRVQKRCYFCYHGRSVSEVNKTDWYCELCGDDFPFSGQNHWENLLYGTY